jgi:hypothetical protein
VSLCLERLFEIDTKSTVMRWGVRPTDNALLLGTSGWRWPNRLRLAAILSASTINQTQALKRECDVVYEFIANTKQH